MMSISINFFSNLLKTFVVYENFTVNIYVSSNFKAAFQICANLYDGHENMEIYRIKSLSYW